MPIPLVLSNHELFRLYCQAAKKWGLLLSGDDNWDGLFLAAPYLEAMHRNVDEYLEWSDAFQAIGDGEIYLFFDSREEMERHYEMTVGDDGPTSLNKYDGPARVYALTCTPDGICENENT